MLNKLALQNAKRLWKDYLTYFLTLCMIAAFMLAFHSLLFSEDIYEMAYYGDTGELSTAGSMLVTFMSISAVVIMLIVAWLVNYMAHFILEKRSREFAIYLLAGMKKNQISALYLRETLLLGLTALLAGLILGTGLQQVLFFLFYKSVGKNYKAHLEISAGSVWLTVCLYILCIGSALLRNRKKFSDMEIIRLLHMDKENEPVRRGQNRVVRWFLPVSAGNIILLYVMLLSGNMSKTGAVLEMAGLVFTFYFFYWGLSGFIMAGMEGGNGKQNCLNLLFYKGDNLFLARQFSSRIRNTCFTLGTLSLLFTFALLGSSFAFMLSDYQNRQLDREYPFDIIMISDDTEKSFVEEEKVILENTDIRDRLVYTVYEDGTDDIRNFLYRHLKAFSDEDTAMMEVKRDIAYYEYDVYMGITDYNDLRKMLGYEEILLRDGQYLIHLSDRVYRELCDMEAAEELGGCLKTDLCFAGYRTEGFAQNGHNGADCLIIVPDDALGQMDRYFSLMAVMGNGDVPEGLSELLYRQAGKTRGYDEINDYIKIGSEDVFLMPASIQVKSREVTELKFLMSTLSFPLFYIGLVFLCVSLTVLSVQQLSDSHKYQFRYGILRRIGMGKKRMRFLIAKQLFFYDLCPVLIAALISGVLVLYIGKQFVMHTGIHTAWGWYFVLSLTCFLGIYLLYFGMTYVQFVRNVEAQNE